MEELSSMIERAKSGDELALQDIFVRHRALLNGAARSKWNIGNDVDDATQRVFIRLPQALSIYEHRADSGFRSYLLTLLDQECAKMKRTFKRRVKPESTPIEADEVKSIIQVKGTGGEDDVILRLMIDECLSRMSPLQQATLRALDETGTTEGVASSGVKYRTKNMRIAVARKKFRELWDATGRVIPHGCKKLTESDVKKIREMAASGMKQKDIAPMFGVTKSFISAIVTGRARIVEPSPEGPLYARTVGPCKSDCSCVFPGLWSGMCRQHALDSVATYSVTRPKTGASWIRTTCRHAYWEYHGTSLRQARGIGAKHKRSRRAILDDDAVRRIRKLHRAGFAARGIAKRFCVGDTCIHDVISGKKWGHVTDVTTTPE